MSLVAYSVKGKHQGVTYLVALACRLQQGSKENWVAEVHLFFNETFLVPKVFDVIGSFEDDKAATDAARTQAHYEIECALHSHPKLQKSASSTGSVIYSLGGSQSLTQNVLVNKSEPHHGNPSPLLVRP